MRSWRASRWIAVAAIAALAIVVAILAFAAYQRANPDLSAQSPVPAPTFTLGAQQSTPTPTVPEPEPVSLEAQRFLSISSAQWWRATAGACDGTEPLVERSPDGGATWVDVTPRYRGIAQVQALDGFSTQDAEMVAAMVGCETQALRTYTFGEFWEPYPDVLAQSRFVDATDAATVVLPSGPVPAPCDTASGLRASGDVVALLCDGRAWRWAADEWQPLAPEGAITLAVDGADVIVAHHSPDCAGIALSRIGASDPDTVIGSACVEGVDPAAPTAIALAGDVWLWSGDSLASVPAP